MRFAASPGFMNAYGLIDSFDPNQLGQQAADGRTLQNRAVMAADAAVRGAELKGEAEVEAAKYLGAAREAQGAAQGMSAAVTGALGGLRGLGGALKSNIGSSSFDLSNPSGASFGQYGDFTSLYSQPAIPFR